MHFLLSLSAPFSLPVLSLVCIPWDITKVTCSKDVSIQIREATVVGLCPSPWQKQSLVLTSALGCCLPGGRSVDGPGGWGHRVPGQHCWLGKAITHPRNCSLVEQGSCFAKLLCRVRDFHLLLDWAVTSLLVIHMDICYVWVIDAAAHNRQGRFAVCALGSSLPCVRGWL